MKNPQTERLKFVFYDDALYQSFVELFTNEDVMRYVDRGVLSKEAARALWDRLTLEFYPQDIKTIWAVVAKEDGRFIGNASVRPRPAHKDETEIGYMLMPQEWGKGYATEIALELVRFGLEELKLNTVFATVDVENEPSIKVLEKAGMKKVRSEYDDLGEFYLFAVSAKK